MKDAELMRGNPFNNMDNSGSFNVKTSGMMMLYSRTRLVEKPRVQNGSSMTPSGVVLIASFCIGDAFPPFGRGAPGRIGAKAQCKATPSMPCKALRAGGGGAGAQVAQGRRRRSWPLRFIDDALSEAVPVSILATYGRNGEKISRSIAEKLGPERTSKIKIVGKEEVERSFYGQLVLGEGVTSSLDEQLTKEAQKAASAEKQRIAEEVASLLKLSVDISTTSKSSEKIIATLRAGSEYVGCDVQNCILVTGSQPSVIAAERIGMPCIVLRSSLTARAEFHSAKAIMDGFGDTDLTISKLLSKRWS